MRYCTKEPNTWMHPADAHQHPKTACTARASTHVFRQPNLSYLPWSGGSPPHHVTWQERIEGEARDLLEVATNS